MNNRVTRALVVVISLISNAYGAASSHRKSEKPPAQIQQIFTRNTETYTQGKIRATRSIAGVYSAIIYKKKRLVTIQEADAMKVFNALKESFAQQPKPVVSPQSPEPAQASTKSKSKHKSKRKPKYQSHLHRRPQRSQDDSDNAVDKSIREQKRTFEAIYSPLLS